jgi:ubiquinone/menaquinone biosynthesis C-methylase UbiE
MGSKQGLMEKWKSTQSAWDDHDFLNVQANAFMKMRWRRLNARCAAVAQGQARFLGKGIDLLDVGCAHADFEPWCRPALKSYTGLEPSRALLPKSIRKGQKFQLVRGQAEKLPFKAKCFDMVLIKEVLDHCWGPDRVLAESFRVLRPGGLCLVTLTNDRAWYKRMLPSRAANIKAGQEDHLYFFEPQQVRGLFEKAGFKTLLQDDSHYLRLPRMVEQGLGRLKESFGFSLITASDAVGRALAPGMGGSFWVQGVKE